MVEDRKLELVAEKETKGVVYSLNAFNVIASFKKMKKLTHHKSLIVAVLKESSLLTLSSNEKKVKRVHPFPLTEALDPELCTVLVENLLEDHIIEYMKKIFGQAGFIKKITIHEENSKKVVEKVKRTMDNLAHKIEEAM